MSTLPIQPRVSTTYGQPVLYNNTQRNSVTTNRAVPLVQKNSRIAYHNHDNYNNIGTSYVQKTPLIQGNSRIDYHNHDNHKIRASYVQQPVVHHQ